MLNRKIVAAVLGLGLAVGLNFGAAAGQNCSYCDVQYTQCLREGGTRPVCEDIRRDCLAREGCLIDW